MKLLVNQKLAIPLYDSEDKISKRMAKPNAKVPVSNVNYGNFSKVIEVVPLLYLPMELCDTFNAFASA